MRTEIRRIEPIRFANVVALAYALISLAFTLLMAPFFLAVPFTDETGGGLARGVTLALLFMYPIFGLIFGWIFGLIGAAVYNLVAGWVGGIYVELRSEAAV